MIAYLLLMVCPLAIMLLVDVASVRWLAPLSPRAWLSRSMQCINSHCIQYGILALFLAAFEAAGITGGLVFIVIALPLPVIGVFFASGHLLWIVFVRNSNFDDGDERDSTFIQTLVADLVLLAWSTTLIILYLLNPLWL